MKLSDVEVAADLGRQIEPLVNVIYIGAGVTISLLVTVTVITWRISRGIAKRDAELETVSDAVAAQRSALEEHEAKCDQRHEADDKWRRFMERSIGRIEGALGIEHNDRP